ncbi:sulfotransferase family 2 domain-containing protein [Caldovatus aquaticus]|uniref:Sulfotransferase family protein n=1 Tax=Caldovatus aquaticus TaxID=2865671 RepID=A0ABS7F3T0_9PROT|nr:sulfotransferase family 2 domain-containing protein [Caldovatus aquaticus]MBW8270188.1 sulfotransferase family protein [Caldovatus aquaticus]
MRDLRPDPISSAHTRGVQRAWDGDRDKGDAPSLGASMPEASGTADGPPGAGGRRKLAFVHIPKTAGTSFTQALRIGWPCAKVVATQAQFDAVNDDDIANIDLIAGHFHAYCLEDRRFLAFDRVTVLRDPFERLFSAYRFGRDAVAAGVEVGPAMRLAAETTFGDWAFSRFGLAQPHSHLWLLGLNADDQPSRVSFAHLLAQAKARLDRMHVGIVDCLDDFVGYLFRHYGLTGPAFVARMNITRRYDPEEAGLTATQKSELMDLLRPDYELYAYGRALMQQRMEVQSRVLA